jgi:predicted MPP superfamily phosphohydrolase
MSLTRIFVALAVLSSVLFGVHYYLWARLVRDPGLPSAWSSAATTALAALGVGTLVGFLLTRFAPRGVASPIMWVVYVWLGVMFFLFMLLVASDLVLGVVALARLAHLLPAADTVDADRRETLARIVAGGVSAAALALSGFGMASALGQVAIKRVRIPLAKLPAGTPPYRLVQLTDIHVGPTIGRDFVADLVARVNALEPDCIVITGDLVDGSVAELGPLTAPLAGLRAKDGVFFVTGNHEYYSGVDEWIAHLTSQGIKVLRNERVAVGPVDLAGVDDWSAKGFGKGHGQDVPRALEGRDTSKPVVLLAHQPQTITEAERLGVDLQLSGHTHGGQMVPWNYAVKLVTPYVAGLYQHKSAALYVSRGTGYWGPPMRVGAPAEITHVELVPG